jgi:hypothetical protein
MCYCRVDTREAQVYTNVTTNVYIGCKMCYCRVDTREAQIYTNVTTNVYIGCKMLLQSRYERCASL